MRSEMKELDSLAEAIRGLLLEAEKLRRNMEKLQKILEQHKENREVVERPETVA